MQIRFLALLATGVLSMPSLAQAQNPEVRMFLPNSKWGVNYADDSCRLGRTFIDNSTLGIFFVDQYDAGPVFNVLLASKALSGTPGQKTRVSFGPSGATKTFNDNLPAELGEYGQAVMVDGLTLVEAPSETVVPSNRADNGASGASIATMEAVNPTVEQERAITWVEVQRGRRPPVRFNLGPMDKPMQALRACTDELLSHWGIDVAAHKTLLKRPVPMSKPGTWMRSSDYPPGLVIRGTQGLVQFRLSVDQTGSVTGCHIQNSTRPAEFDKAVCTALSKRARFDPAIDANGRAINSYWRSSVRFIIER